MTIRIKTILMETREKHAKICFILLLFVLTLRISLFKTEAAEKQAEKMVIERVS